MVCLDSKPATKPQVLTFRRSVLAVAVMACTSSTFGQNADQNQPLAIDEEIIVTGVRQNLQNAQDIKRDADTFVDAISAEDMGALPDRSVLEAMQRLPGVSIERFAAPEDPDHFGVEGSGAVIRGMTATRSEFNGRDSFTANSGRGLSFQDVPPELMGGVDLYKNQTADMIEGGIGGTVSLRTRKPFDQQGQVFSISGDLSYGDMAEKWSPTISALFSDRWDTSAGEFGLLLNVADSTLYGESHGIQSDTYLLYDASTIPGAERFVVEGEDYHDGVGHNGVWIPQGSNFFTKEDDRKRKGYAAAIQWGSPDETMTATFQAMRSDANLSWKENAIKYQGGYKESDGNRRARPYPGTEFTFNDQGIFEAGYITDAAGWRGPADQPERVPSGDDSGYFGQKFQADTRYQETRTVIDDFGLNVNWTPSDAWEFEADAQYIKARTWQDDLQIANGFYALQNYDATGDTPTLEVVEPWDGRREANPENYADHPGFGDDPLGDANYFQDAHNYWWRSAMDHYERSNGESVAGRLDATRYFDDVPLLRAVKTGVRYAERDQIVRVTSYNWGHIGAEYASPGDGPLWLDETPQLANYYEYQDWSEFHRGDVATIPGDGFLFPTEKLLKQVIAGREMPQNNPEADGIWEPYPSRSGRVGDSIFTPDEIYDTTEKNNAAYVRVDFGSDETALRFSGNVGLRYVKLERESIGSVQFPDFDVVEIPEGAPTDVTDREAIYAWADSVVPPVNANDNDPATPDSLEARGELMNRAMSYARTGVNWLSADDRAFANDSYELGTKTHEYSTVLPSFNLKVELTPDLIARTAVSKAIAWPDMSEVRNQAVLGSQPLAVSYQGQAVEGYEYVTGQDIREVSPVDWEGSGGNPELDPMESIQYDLSLEWYFADVGSLTGSVFYKDLKNFFIAGAYPETYTNASTGVARTVTMDGTRNGGDGTMEGFEIAYQQFYDMLPEPFDGLGLQLNYTYIKSEGVPNFEDSDGEPQPDEDIEIDTDAQRYYDGLPLRGQSKDTFNIVAMYEKYDWSVRLAYNWRSRYLVTTRDRISKHPIWNDDAGFLDGSIFYDINDNIQVGVQFTNLLDTQTKTIMVLDDEGREANRTWFVNDRRAALVARATF